MRKLKLDIQELEIESFTVSSSPVGGGTVEGRVKPPPLDPVPVSAFFTECGWYCYTVMADTCQSCMTCENMGSCGLYTTCLRSGACGPT